MTDVKRIHLRYPGTCWLCANPVPAGREAGWDRVAKRVICLSCLPLAEALPLDPGTPGASLEREYERRTSARASRVRGRFPRAGGFILAVSGEPGSTTAFARGAEGERWLAARLEKLCGDDVLLLHNRRRGSRAGSGDIDHIAVAASGVYVIDAKHYKGAKVTVRRTGGVLRPLREQLMIRGRDKTSLVESLNKQFMAVTQAMGDHSAPVTALFCFIDADLPLLEKPTVGGVPVLGPRGTSKLLQRPGPFGPDQRRKLWERLARALPPA